MSETLETATQGGAAAEPAATEPEATAPVDTGAATETTPPDNDEGLSARALTRIRSLTAKLSHEGRQREALAEEVAALRARLPSPEPEKPITADDIPRIVDERVAAEVERRAAQERVQAFHRAGAAEHKDWNDRCQSLIQMGADAQFSAVLLDMEPAEGAKVAAALADDPEELERIVGLKTDRAKAIALGKYAAAMEAKPATVRRVTRAPEPIRPINGATARTEINEYTMGADDLADLYMRQNLERRQKRA